MRLPSLTSGRARWVVLAVVLLAAVVLALVVPLPTALELRDRVGPAPVSGPESSGVLTGTWTEQVRSALVGLGWTQAQADSAVAAVAEHLDGEVPPVPVLLKQAIRLLGRIR